MFIDVLLRCGVWINNSQNDWIIKLKSNGVLGKLKKFRIDFNT